MCVRVWSNVHERVDGPLDRSSRGPLFLALAAKKTHVAMHDRRRGYTTGTFDLPHDGHFQILSLMRAQCDHLTVGLTTDALGEAQKRRPVLSFSHRRAILQHCKHVDAVVAHAGESKSDAHARLGFDILFVGDDYLHALEYANLAMPVRFFPRTQGICSSDVWAGLQRRCLQETSPLCMSLSGPILRAGEGTVVKPILVGQSEHDPAPSLASTADAYDVAVLEPRNWKGTSDDYLPRFPNLQGISPFRELFVSLALSKYAWFAAKEWSLKYEDPSAPRVEKGSGVQRIVAERQRPRAVYWLAQRHAGVSLDAWWAERGRDGGATEEEGVLAQVRSILSDLQREGVVHGDVHGGNLCIDPSGRVSLVDFGWCVWRGFALSCQERSLLEERLASGFDWMHFERAFLAPRRRRSEAAEDG